MKESVIAELKIIPLGTGTTNISPYVKAAIAVVKKTQGITFQITPMATIVQGPMNTIMAMVQEMHEVPFTMGATRVLTSISIDDRRDKGATMESKVKAVS
jgi:uncharacterized protein (TIGR00106 family)